MQTRLISAAALTSLVVGQASATPEDFDFFFIEAAVGIGGDIEGELLDSDFDSAFITGPGADVLEIDLSGGDRTLFSRMDYNVDVLSSPESLVLTASFDASAEIVFGPSDASGLVSAFASFDSFNIQFTLDEPQLLTLSHGSAFLAGLGGTPHVGDVDAGITLVPTGSYELTSDAQQFLFDTNRSPADGDQSLAGLLDFSVGLTAIPSPGTALVLALGGCGLARRRR